MASCKIFLLFTLFSSFQFFSVQSVEFEVGNDKSWVVPSSKNEQVYNQWASKNRFQVDDTIRFNYKKDSVLVVTDSEYDKCRSVHPIFFSNNGDTVFKFEHSGLFYFISGIAGHCEKGQKMIIKVLEHEHTPPPSSNQNETASSPAASSDPNQSGAVPMAGISSLIIDQFVFLLVGFLFIQSY